MNQIFFIQAGKVYDGRECLVDGIETFPEVEEPTKFVLGVITLVILPPEYNANKYFLKYYSTWVGCTDFDQYEYGCFVNSAF